jgi:hypothetical protein
MPGILEISRLEGKLTMRNIVLRDLCSQWSLGRPPPSAPTNVDSPTDCLLTIVPFLWLLWNDMTENIRHIMSLISSVQTRNLIRKRCHTLGKSTATQMQITHHREASLKWSFIPIHVVLDGWGSNKKNRWQVYVSSFFLYYVKSVSHRMRN